MWKKLAVVGITSTLISALALSGVEAANKPLTKNRITDGAVYTNFRTTANTYGVHESETWAFDKNTAITNYLLENATPTSTVTCGGGGGCSTHTSVPKIYSGTAPALTLTSSEWNAEECIFWGGGDLSDFVITVTEKVSGGSGSTKWTDTHTYTFNYVGQVVESRTSWTLEAKSEPGTVQVNFLGKVAGLTGMNWDTGYKFTFGVKNADGTAQISNPVLNITLADGSVQQIPLNYNYVDSSMADFSEFGIGQVTNGFGYGYNLNQTMAFPDSSIASAFPSSGATLWATDARTLLNSDAFAGNDNGGVDGSQLAYINFEPTKVDLPAGDFTYTLSATVKGMLGVTDGTTVTIARNVNIIGLGNCQP